MSKEDILAAIDSENVHQHVEANADDVRALLLEGKVIPKINENGATILVRNTMVSDNEDLRLERLKDVLDGDWEIIDFIGHAMKESCFHEIMDRSMIIIENLEGYLLEHPSVVVDPGLHELGCKALKYLFDFYQLAGMRDSNISEIEEKNGLDT